MKYFLILFIAILFSHQASAIKLQSSDIFEGQKMSKQFEFNGFGCEGDNKLPNISWDLASLPEGTKSLAVTVFDPDAPTNSGFWHWLVVNIPTTIDNTFALIGNDAQGLTIKNGFGNYQFDGACPPVNDGMHRYQFTVWALPQESLEVSKDTPAAIIGFMLNSSSLEMARLTTTYARTAIIKFADTNPINVDESQGVLPITIIREGSGNGEALFSVQINFQSANNADVGVVKTALVFTDGEKSIQFDLNIIDDYLVEGDESFTVSLSQAPSSLPVDNKVIEVTISDNSSGGSWGYFLILILIFKTIKLLEASTVLNYYNSFTKWCWK
jgi:Raf kinase inhibitor-like YbhB/YbcL family protein